MHSIQSSLAVELHDTKTLLCLNSKNATLIDMFNRFRTFAKRGYEIAKNDRAYVYMNIGTVTGLVGFCMSDPLPLRSCSIVSSVTGMYFQLTRVPVHSYVPIYWGCCFMAVNVYKIIELLHERRTIHLSDAEEDIYCHHFQV